MGGLPGCQEGVGLIWRVIPYCMVGFGALVNAVKILVFDYRPPSRAATGGPGVSPCHCLGSGAQVGDGGLNHMGMRSR